MHIFGGGPVRGWRRVTDRRGFTLVELMITMTVLAVVMVVLMTVMYTAQRSKAATANRIESAQAARAAIELMAKDLRSAGYGADLDYPQPQPPIAYVDSLQVLINANLDPYPDTTNALHQPPLAYDPSGNPKPFPLSGTEWEPPIKYRQGAELIRWTLDNNNDGVVSSADIGPPNGGDAATTPNPSDYVLLRQVLGDSTGNVAGNNGPVLTERVGLVRSPGGGVPAMYTVYFQGSSTPWDWSLGPVPASRLQDIERVEIQIVATSARPDWRGNFAETRLKTEVSSLRNTPNVGEKQYVIDGTVYLDANTDGNQDLPTEIGIPSVTMRLGSGMTTNTSASGYFQFRVPAGTYVLRQVPPAGYGVWTNPDSFIVSVPPAQNRDFGDTLAVGGWVNAFVYNDGDNSSDFDSGESAMSGVKLTMSPGGQVAYTDVTGHATLFASVGSYSVTITPPESLSCTTSNPVSGTMVNGGSDDIEFGLFNAPLATVKGKVYNDNNRNGLFDTGETGMSNVWVGVTPDNGVTVVGYQYTNASGDFDFTVPANDPPGTNPYYVTCIIPNGYYATSSTSLGPHLLSDSEILIDQNFGVKGFQIITLNASRVLSLASGDVIEKDWNGNQTGNARKDSDIILGADAAGTDNVSVWFNKYDSSPLFSATRDYWRTAPQSVLSLSADTLDSTSPKLRLDIATGTTNASGGNFFVWFNQNSSGNEGILPSSYSTGRNYRTSDAGDVTQLLTADLCGNSSPDQLDILVGTKSPTAGQGTIELWKSDNAATPAWSRDETYPPKGNLPGNLLGEVTAMALADFDSPPDGKRDLVVGTRTGTFTGQLIFLKNQGKTGGPQRFSHQVTYTLTSAAVTSLTVLDVNLDNKQDVVLGIQTGTGTGLVQYWSNQTLAVWDFFMSRELTAPGLPLALASADFGGLSTRKDVVMGWRENETSYVGGVLIYFMDLGTLPPSGSDPSGGAVTHMVPAMTINNFNYGVKPSTPSPPYLPDFAAGVKVDATSGALVVFIR